MQKKLKLIIIFLIFSCQNAKKETIKPIERKDFESISEFIFDETFGSQSNATLSG